MKYLKIDENFFHGCKYPLYPISTPFLQSEDLFFQGRFSIKSYWNKKKAFFSTGLFQCQNFGLFQRMFWRLPCSDSLPGQVVYKVTGVVSLFQEGERNHGTMIRNSRIYIIQLKFEVIYVIYSSSNLFLNFILIFSILYLNLIILFIIFLFYSYSYSILFCVLYSVFPPANRE